jgi:phospholipase C
MAVSRREVIAGAGALAGATGVQACKTDETDSGADPGPATIDTIIVVMMENRSFDHMLGGLTLAEGRTDLDGLTAEMSNPDDAGNLVHPYPNEIGCVEDPPHSWSAGQAQFNEGANDGFVRAYGGPGVMQYQVRTDVPILWALADEYAVCDQYFCSVMSSTWPNRFYAHCGTSLGMPGNDFPTEGSYPLPNVWAKLAEKGVEAQYYYSDLPFLMLVRDAWHASQARYIEDFVRDAEAGRLPPVVWVEPGFSFNDDHPPHHVALGQEFLAVIYKALSRSPQWNNCLLLITYDEHGGFFDHVPPPKCEDEYAAEGFDQLGFRVPSLAIGPYVKQGAVSTVLDHTSWLKFVCERHGLEPWTTRIATANSLAAVLDTERMADRDPRPPIELPVFDFDEESLGSECSYSGVLGPPPPPESTPGPPPPPGARPPTPMPAVVEPWHGLMRAVYREEDRTEEWLRLKRWLHAYLRDESPPTVFDRKR